MNRATRYLGLLVLILLVAGCQGNRTLGSSDGESRYAKKQDPNTYLNTPAYINTQLGVAYMQEGNLALALAKLKKALAQNPDLAITHSTIAVLYERMGENGLAEQHHEQAVSHDAQDPRIRNNYGRFLCNHHNIAGGIEQFKIAANNPLYTSAHVPLANAAACAMKTGDIHQADQYYRQALDKQPKLPMALEGMIRVSLESKRHLQGRAYLQRYLEVARHTPDTLWMGYQIEKYLGDKDASANYAVRLKSRYPDSAQTRLLLDELSRR